MKFLKLSFVLLPLLLSACATYHPTAFNLPDGAKVGYHVDLDESVGISKEGSVVRVFGEFSKKEEGLNWDLQDYTKVEVARILIKYGFLPVDVTEVLLNDSTGLYLESKKPVIFPRKKVDAFTAMYEEANRKYEEKYGVEAVIRIHSRPAIISRGSGSAENSVTWGLYHGYLYKTPPFSKTKHNVLFAANDSAFLLNPYQNVVNWSGPYKNGDLLYTNEKEIFDFQPEDSKNLTPSEWERIKKELKAYISERLEQHIRALRAGADGQGGHVNSP